MSSYDPWALENNPGFILFSQSIKRKMGWSQRLDAYSHILQDAARPAWEKLPAEEKAQWEERAWEVEKTGVGRCSSPPPAPPPTPIHRRRPPRPLSSISTSAPPRRVRTTRNIHFRGVAESDQDEEAEEEDCDFSTLHLSSPPLPPLFAEDDKDVQPADPPAHLVEKRARDRERVHAWLAGMTKAQIIDLRWLMLSVQTFGRNERETLLAETALDEFTLADGVLDRLGAIVSGWTVDCPILESRAHFHSNETHCIELTAEDPNLLKRQLLAEMLGRMEPAIAAAQSVAVGLYAKATTTAAPFAPVPPAPYAEGYRGEGGGVRLDSGDPLDDFLGRLTVDDSFDSQFLSPCGAGRRPILVLSHEYDAARESLASFKNRMRLDYDGLPTEESRFILVEAFVDGVADALGGSAMDKFDGALAELGKRLPGGAATPWEKGDELFCPYHAASRNACCTAVTAARSVFIMLFALEKLIKE